MTFWLYIELFFIITSDGCELVCICLYCSLCFRLKQTQDNMWKREKMWMIKRKSDLAWVWFTKLHWIPINIPLTSDNITKDCVCLVKFVWEDVNLPLSCVILFFSTYCAPKGVEIQACTGGIPLYKHIYTHVWNQWKVPYSCLYEDEKNTAKLFHSSYFSHSVILSEWDFWQKIHC